jgi:hypothetical protein
MKNVSKHPCPICKEMMLVIGESPKGEKLTSCGHKYSFKKTRSQKEADRKYIKTEWGLEKVQ